MASPYVAVQCCEQVEAALSDNDIAAVHNKLQETEDLLTAENLPDTAYEELKKRLVSWLINHSSMYDK